MKKNKISWLYHYLQRILYYSHLCIHQCLQELPCKHNRGDTKLIMVYTPDLNLSRFLSSVAKPLRSIASVSTIYYYMRWAESGLPVWVLVVGTAYLFEFAWILCTRWHVKIMLYHTATVNSNSKTSAVSQRKEQLSGNILWARRAPPCLPKGCKPQSGVSSGLILTGALWMESAKSGMELLQ